MVSPPLTPAMTPAVDSIASSTRAPAVSGNPVSASWMAPMKLMPARSVMMPAVTTSDGETPTSAAATPTAISVASRPPATCW